MYVKVILYVFLSLPVSLKLQLLPPPTGVPSLNDADAPFLRVRFTALDAVPHSSRPVPVPKAVEAAVTLLIIMSLPAPFWSINVILFAATLKSMHAKLTGNVHFSGRLKTPGCGAGAGAGWTCGGGA